MTTETDGVVTATHASQAAATTAREGTKATINRFKSWIMYISLIVVGIIILMATNWSFSIGLLYAGGLYFGSGQVKSVLPKGKHESIPGVMKMMGIIFFLGSILLTQVGTSMLYVVDETADCIGTIGNSSNNSCFEGGPTTPGNVTPEVMTPQPYLAPFAEVSDCSRGWDWDKVVDVPAGYSLTWGWKVEAQYIEAGQLPVDYTGITDGDMAMFCSDKPGYSGRNMPLSWDVL